MSICSLPQREKTVGAVNVEHHLGVEELDLVLEVPSDQLLDGADVHQQVRSLVKDYLQVLRTQLVGFKVRKGGITPKELQIELFPELADAVKL